MSLIWTLRRQHLPDTQRWYFVALILAFVVENSSAALLITDQNNAWLYNLYVPLEFYLLAIMAERILNKRWSTALAAVGGAGYAALYLYEVTREGAFDLLDSRSTLLAYAIQTVLYAALLIELAERTTTVLWREQRFWVFLSVFLFMGPVIPYVGMMNEVYQRDAMLANSLFLIVDVLFILRYSAALIAGLMIFDPERST